MVPEGLLSFNESLNYPLLKIQNYEISVWTIFVFFLIIYLSKFFARKFSTLITYTYFRQANIDKGRQDAITKILHYTIYCLGILIALQTIGINLSALMAGGAILAVGIGFGIQNLVTNFVAGILLLLEQPIKKGDFIEISKDVFGVVTEIAIRSTTIKTLDNVTILIPNSKFVTENITNWTYRDSQIKIRMSVTVPYSSDIKQVEQLLTGILRNEADILTTPEPTVQLELIPTGLIFYLLFWINDPLLYNIIRSNINFAVAETLKAEGILR
jgi:potassium efflux system protein